MVSIKIRGDVYRVAVDGGKPQWLPQSLQMLPPQVSQEDVTEAQLPASERPSITIRDVSDGYGQEEQPLDGPIRKFDRIGDAEGEGVDPSLTPFGPIILPPARWLSISGGEGGRNLVRALQYQTDSARVFYGDDIYTYTGWIPTDVGTLSTLVNGQPVAFRGSQPQEYWYAPLGAGVTPQYSTDQGGTWTGVTTTGGLTEAIDFCVADGRVYVLYTGQYGSALRWFADGGVNPTLFGTIDPITTQSSAAIRLLNWQDRIVVVSNQECLMVVGDRDEKVQNLLPEVTFSGDQIYPDGCTVWRGILLVPTTQGLAAIAPGGGYQWVGPDSESLLAASAGRAAGVGHKGVIQAVVGDAYNLYGFLGTPSFVSASTPGWLFKANVAVSGGQIADIDWFPILNMGVVNRCFGMCVIRHRIADFGGQPTKSMLVAVQQYGAIGSFGNINLYLFRLPNFGRDPRADPYYRYSLLGTLYNSRLNARFPAFSKDWLSITPRTGDLGYGVDGQTAVTGLGIQPRYKTDVTPLGATAPYGYTVATTQGATEATGVRADLTDIRARGLDTAVRFSTSHAFSDQTPQLWSLTTDYRPAPGSIWVHEFVLDCGSQSYDPSGMGGYADPVTPDVAYHKLRTLPSAAPFDLELPTGLTVKVFCPPGGVKPQMVGMPEEGYEGAIPMKVRVLFVETKPAEERER